VRQLNSSRRQSSGFTYLLLVLAVTVLAVGLAAIGTMTSAASRHSKQQQLEWVGHQYINAIGDYYQSSPGSVPIYPRELSDLTEDKRYLSMRRHIRELYSDPATGEQDWILIKAPDGGVMGVQSSEADGFPTFSFEYLPPSSTASSMSSK
jgi:type II secretory pathway pseudopilin PulG